MDPNQNPDKKPNRDLTFIDVIFLIVLTIIGIGIILCCLYLLYSAIVHFDNYRYETLFHIGEPCRDGYDCYDGYCFNYYCHDYKTYVKKEANHLRNLYGI